VLLFVAAVAIVSLPALRTPRFFGTFLPSVVAFSILAHIICSRFLWNDRIANTLRVMVIAVLLLAGINRSFWVVNSFNPQSEQILSYDSKFIYGAYGKVTIPEQRRSEKEFHLLSLGIYSEFTIDSLRLRQYTTDQEAGKKIIFPKYKISDF
ncbi:MAG: hypothetical protein ACK4S0_05975, partial [Sediminibacterium sp.]